MPHRLAGIGVLASLCGAVPAVAAESVADFVECEIVEGALQPGVRPARDIRARFADDHVAEIALRRPDGGDTRTVLERRRTGVSTRGLLWQPPHAPGSWMHTFNLVSLQPDGAVLAETWVTAASRPTETQYSWLRLRCGAPS